MEHPAGEADDGSLRVDFDRRLKLEFHGSRITSDAGLLAYRELDDALGLTDLAGSALSECRRGRNTRHLLTGLLRQSVFGRLAGYEDVNDADRLAHDPAMRAVVDRGGLDRRAASTSPLFNLLSYAAFTVRRRYNKTTVCNKLVMPPCLNITKPYPVTLRCVSNYSFAFFHFFCNIFRRTFCNSCTPYLGGSSYFISYDGSIFCIG